VVARRPFGDEQPLGDLTVGHATREEPENLLLARSQGERLGRLPLDGSGRQELDTTAGGDRLNRMLEGGRTHGDCRLVGFAERGRGTSRGTVRSEERFTLTVARVRACVRLGQVSELRRDPAPRSGIAPPIGSCRLRLAKGKEGLRQANMLGPSSTDVRVMVAHGCQVGLGLGAGKS
jgi:hypothetical protein